MVEYKAVWIKNGQQDERSFSAHNDGEALTEVASIVESKDVDEVYCYIGVELIFNYIRPREFSYIIVNKDKIVSSDTMVASSIYRARLLVRNKMVKYSSNSYAVVTFGNERSIVES